MQIHRLVTTKVAMNCLAVSKNTYLGPCQGSLYWAIHSGEYMKPPTQCMPVPPEEPQHLKEPYTIPEEPQHLKEPYTIPEEPQHLKEPPEEPYIEELEYGLSNDYDGDDYDGDYDDNYDDDDYDDNYDDDYVGECEDSDSDSDNDDEWFLYSKW